MTYELSLYVLGHVDPGENEPETALREVQEETGLQRSDLKTIPGFEKVLNVCINVCIIMCYFYCLHFGRFIV